MVPENQVEGKVVEIPGIYKVLYITGGCLRFLPSTVSHDKSAHILLWKMCSILLYDLVTKTPS